MSTVLHEQRHKLQIQISNSISEIHIEIRKHGNLSMVVNQYSYDTYGTAVNIRVYNI